MSDVFHNVRREVRIASRIYDGLQAYLVPSYILAYDVMNNTDILVDLHA